MAIAYKSPTSIAAPAVICHRKCLRIYVVGQTRLYIQRSAYKDSVVNVVQPSAITAHEAHDAGDHPETISTKLVYVSLVCSTSTSALLTDSERRELSWQGSKGPDCLSRSSQTSSSSLQHILCIVQRTKARELRKIGAGR